MNTMLIHKNNNLQKIFKILFDTSYNLNYYLIMGKKSNNSDIETSSRPTIEDVIKKHKLSIDDLIVCAKEGLKATRDGHDYDDDGDKVQIPDHNVRHKYLESLLNILGYLKPQSISIQNVQISTEEKELLEAYKQTTTRVK